MLNSIKHLANSLMILHKELGYTEGHTPFIADMKTFLSNVKYLGISNPDHILTGWELAVSHLPEQHESKAMLTNWCKDNYAQCLVTPIVTQGVASLYKGYLLIRVD